MIELNRWEPRQFNLFRRAAPTKAFSDQL